MWQFAFAAFAFRAVNAKSELCSNGDKLIRDTNQVKARKIYVIQEPIWDAC